MKMSSKRASEVWKDLPIFKKRKELTDAERRLYCGEYYIALTDEERSQVSLEEFLRRKEWNRESRD